MRFRLGIGCLLFAWLCASGGLLDVTQVFAWARMFAGYAESMPLHAAADLTFEASKPCDICIAVMDAREASADTKQAPAAPASTELGKVILIVQKTDALVVAPALEAWPRANDWFAQPRYYPVPVPPPRGGAGRLAS